MQLVRLSSTAKSITMLVLNMVGATLCNCSFAWRLGNTRGTCGGHTHDNRGAICLVYKHLSYNRNLLRGQLRLGGSYPRSTIMERKPLLATCISRLASSRDHRFLAPLRRFQEGLGSESSSSLRVQVSFAPSCSIRLLAHVSAPLIERRRRPASILRLATRLRESNR